MMSINNVSVFSKEDIEKYLCEACQEGKESFHFTFAPDKNSDSFTEKGTPE